MGRILTILLAFALCTGLAMAQTVSGSVTDAEGGEPLPGVAVLCGERSAISDIDGFWSIKASPGETLHFSCIGMIPVDVVLGDETRVDVVMKADVQVLGDAMVVAYGTARKETFTGSAEVVRGDRLRDRPSADVTSVLDGQVAGVMATSSSGQPGSGAGLVIRGFGSVNASNSPLIVVDGVAFDGNLNSISTDDIKSISVLKDASAGALYGARGANGVVLITTGRGAAGEKMSVDFSARVGVSSRAIPAYETMDAKQYMEHMYRLSYNDLTYVEGYAPALARSSAADHLSSLILGMDGKYNPYDKDVHALFDANGKVVDGAGLKWDDKWLDEAMADMPVRQEYRFGVSGSSERATYNASLSWLNEEGTLATTGFTRYTLRVGADFKPKEWMNFSADVNYANTDSQFLGADGSTNSNVWYSAMMMAPIYPVYERDEYGSYVVEGGSRVFDYGMSRPAGAQNNRNCIATLYDDDYYTISDDLSLRTRLALHHGGFELSTSFGADNVNDYRTTKYNPFNGNAAGTGRLRKENSRLLSYTWNQLLMFKKETPMGNFDIMAGHEYYHYNYRYLTGERTGFSFAKFDELALGANITDGNSAADNYGVDSFLSRLNYNWADRYYLSASCRTDASSRFERSRRRGFFWSLGASWRMSEEEFLKDAAWLDNLTAKASYGVQGNDNIGSYYAWQAMYNTYWSNGSHAGAIVESIENVDVSWEKNANLNLGAEFRLFGRLYGTVEWYSRKTSDLLLEYPMPISLGFSGYNSNVGAIRNNGTDITLGADLIAREDMRWNVTLMASTVHNKVLSLTGKGNDDIISGVLLIRPGEEINSFYMSKSAGVDPATGEQLYYAYERDGDGNPLPGSEYVTNDATAAAASKYILGSRLPDMYGSFGTSFSMGAWDFNALLSWSIGGKVYDSVYRSLMEPSFVGQTYHVNALRSWASPGDVTDVPRAGADLATVISDRFLIDASYLSVKSLSIGYNLPETVTGACGLAGARVSLAADNIWTFTHLKGMNPQQSFSGYTSYSYIPSRTVSLGVDIKF